MCNVTEGILVIEEERNSEQSLYDYTDGKTYLI